MANAMYFILILFNNKFLYTVSIKSPELMLATDSNGMNHTGIGALSPGQSIIIYCSHVNDIKWTRFDSKKTKSEILSSNKNIHIDKNKLNITNISFNDSGVYYCEQDAVAYRFTLHVFTISKQNGTVKTVLVTNTFNGITFNQSKLSDRISGKLSCYCDSASYNSKLNIVWNGGVYDKFSDNYTIEIINTGTGVNSTLILKKTQNIRELYGEYICSCNVLSDTNRDTKVYLQVPPIFDEKELSMRVTEGDNVTLECNVWGYPDVLNSSIRWSFQNNFQLRDSIVELKDSSRPGFSKLIIPRVTSADRGVYICHASNSIGSNTVGTMLRVRGRYAILWPFIGIVIQLVILIAIIVVYEWKKKHQPKEESSNVNPPSNAEPDAICSDRGNETHSVRQRLVKA